MEAAVCRPALGGTGAVEVPSGLAPTGVERRVIRLYELVFAGQVPRRGARPLHLGFWHGSTRSHREALENEDRTLARMAGIGAGSRVLDAGCGYGSSALWLAREIGAEVVGVDLAPGHIVRARRLAARSGAAGRVRFYRRDFRNTGFAGGTFDVVWAVESLCHVADGASFFLEAHRLLKPGGRLVVADLFCPARSLDDGESSMQRRWIAGWAIPGLTTGEELARVAEGAGFGRVELEDATAEVWPSSRRLHRRALLGLPAARALHAAGALSGERLAALRSGLLQFEALGRGLWSYGVLVATKPGGGAPAGERVRGGAPC